MLTADVYSDIAKGLHTVAKIVSARDNPTGQHAIIILYVSEEDVRLLIQCVTGNIMMKDTAAIPNPHAMRRLSSKDYALAMQTMYAASRISDILYQFVLTLSA